MDEARIKSSLFGWGSTYGNGQEVMAYGIHYITVYGKDDHSYYDGVNDFFFGGTSNATPMAAGAYALLKSVIPGQTSAWYRVRMRETADDIQVPGYDDETGWGRVNLIRACYGSDRYASEEDSNGFVDLAAHDGTVFDSVHNVNGTDYGEYVDTSDLFKYTTTEAGTLLLHLDIFTWGENLNLEVFDDPSLTPEHLVDQSTVVNHATTSNEVCYALCKPGETYYIRVTGANEGDSSAYGLSASVIDDYFTMQHGSYDPGFIHKSGSNKLLGWFDLQTGSRVKLTRVNLSVQGSMPVAKITKIQLWRDSNGDGTFQSDKDKLIDEGSFHQTNRAVFDGFEEEVNFIENPVRFFIRANFNNISQDADSQLLLTSYKDIETLDGKTIDYREFPKYFGPYYVGVDVTDPTWDTTVGIQASTAVWEGVIVKWNNASDSQTPPIDYNVYWTQELPFDFATAQHLDDVARIDDEDYDHAFQVNSLNGGEEYFFAVRAQDQADNEEDNEVYIVAYPLIDITPPVWDTTVGIQDIEPLHHGALVKWNSASDDLTEPVEYNVYWTQESPFEFSTASHEDAVQSWEGLGYEHVWHLDGLDNDEEYFVAVRAEDQAGNEDQNEVNLPVTPAMVGNPHMPILIGSHDTGNAWEVECDPANERLFVADSSGGVLVIDVSDPTAPEIAQQIPAPAVYGVCFDGTYVYAIAGNGLKIIDPNGPTGAEVIGTADITYGLDVQAVGNWVYVTDQITNLYPVDLTDPENPVVYPMVQSGEIGYGMDAQGGYLYVATNTKPRVFSLADPSAPVEVKVFGGDGAYEIDAIGDRLYVTYWDARRVTIYSLTDPANPVWLGNWSSNSGYGGSDVVFLHGYLYFGTNDHYIEVLNVDNPASIFEVGQIATDGPDGMNTDGVFIYSAENENGIKVIL
jgi:hypothetical protein